jgi:hypothetical protein
MCDVRGGFGKALSKKGLGNIIVRMVLRAGRRVSREQLKQDPRTTAYGLPLLVPYNYLLLRSPDPSGSNPPCLTVP